MSQSIKAAMLPVKDRSGEVLYYVKAASAQRLIDAGSAQPVGTKNVVRALLVNPSEDGAKVVPISAYKGQRYSHKRETGENVAGVWTHSSHFSSEDRPVFTRVVTDCLAAAA